MRWCKNLHFPSQVVNSNGLKLENHEKAELMLFEIWRQILVEPVGNVDSRGLLEAGSE